MSTGRWMDKKDVVHIYNRILLSHRKEQNWVIHRDLGWPRVYRTKWNKSEIERQILLINAYMWNLEKWYRWTFLQGGSRETEVDKGHVDMEGWWRWDELREYIPSVRQRVKRKMPCSTGSSAWSSGDLGGWLAGMVGGTSALPKVFTFISGSKDLLTK